MKVDVVVAAYNQFQYWSRLCQGFAWNAEHINSVILSLDDIPTTEQQDFLQAEFEKSVPGIPLTITSHPHNGFGLCKTANQGIALSTTEYVLLVEGDEILAPNVSQDFSLAKPGTLACCRKKYIDPNEGINPPKFIANDHRETYFKGGDLQQRPWLLCSGGHLLIHRKIHDKINGFDEGYAYGFHDYDYAIRWIDSGGTLDYGGGDVWHIDSGCGRQSDPASYQRFLPVVANHYDNRYNIGCGRKRLPEYLNVDGWKGSIADVIYDCSNLSWIPSGTAKEVLVEHFIEHLAGPVAVRFLETCHKALIPGGQLIMTYPDVVKCSIVLTTQPGMQLAAMQGIFGDQLDSDVNPLQLHRWGWSAQSMRSLLEDIGFEVTYAGDDYTAPNFGWRDSRIEAYKEEKNG